MAETISGLRGGLVTYVAYNSAFDPLVESQVFAYLKGLHAEHGLRFTVLTFEPADSPAYLDRVAAEALDRELGSHHIRWIPLRYHQRPSLLATIWDILVGAARVASEARKERPLLVHARSDVAAAQGWLVRLLTGIPFLFDCRGLLADEYADAGHWQRTGLNYRLTRAAENALLRVASHVVVLTAALRGSLLAGSNGLPRLADGQVTTIPTCVDLERFTPDAAQHPSGQVTLCYAGSVGTRNLLPEMLEFARVASQRIGGLRFLILNRGQHDLINAEIAARGLADLCEVRAVNSADMPAQLRAADAAISFVRPSFATSATSPTKIGEYLATGLPVVANAGVGDVEELLKDVGVVVNDFTAVSYETAVTELLTRLQDRAGTAKASRLRAESDLSLAEGIRRYSVAYAATLASVKRRG